MSDTGSSNGPPSRQEYDWSSALTSGEKATRPAARSGRAKQAPARPDGPRRGFRLGLIGWAMVAVSMVIIAGGATLAWMGWTFQVEAQRKVADERGLVPVSRDFAPGQGKPEGVLFRLGGSRQLAEGVYSDLVSAWMRARGYTGVSESVDGRVITISGARNGEQGRVLLALGSAHGGFEAMTEGRVEGVMSARRIQPAEADRLSARGDMTSAGAERIIAIDAVLVLVHRSNPLTSIPVDTLASIMSGEITQWNQVDPSLDGAIAIKTEAPGPDAEGTPLGRLLGDKELPDAVQPLPDSESVAEAVARTPLAIGLARRGEAAGNAKALSLSERNARITGPDDFALATEAYPFAERVHLYIASANADRALQDFATFAQSAAGQEIVARNRLTPQRLEAVQIVAPPDAPRDYAAFARDHRRMNFDLRFDQGANELDSRAVEDIRRFAEWLKANNVEGRRVALLGFADNVGARATNLGLAQSRAEAAGVALERAGVTPGILRTYGDSMPVGANAEESGRIRNRRVEVWVCAPPACPLVDLVSQARSATRDIPSGVRLGPPPPTPPGEEGPKG